MLRISPLLQSQDVTVPPWGSTASGGEGAALSSRCSQEGLPHASAHLLFSSEPSSARTACFPLPPCFILKGEPVVESFQAHAKRIHVVQDPAGSRAG